MIGYSANVFPPGAENLGLGLTVQANMLNLHTIVYKKLKSMENGEESQISSNLTINQISCSCAPSGIFFNELTKVSSMEPLEPMYLFYSFKT
jgi:hypothetical protein